ncbi:MAG: UDP-N-acetylmuramoyl-L-alanine--D-glutamate ligase [Acidimicrobiaceae bacterium]
MFRPTGFSDLAQKRVGIYGYGLEGRASEQLLSGICELVIVDDDPKAGVLVTSSGGLEELMTCDVVLKSPGVPRRSASVVQLEKNNVYVTSSLNLWMNQADRSRVIGITGTKGKSTTTALITFFLQCLGEKAQRLGNIGLPPYDTSVDTSTGWLVVEISSFQATDLDVAPKTVVLTSLGSDHIDWHGSLEQYRSDKLQLTRASGEHTTFVPNSEVVHSESSQIGGTVVYVDSETSTLTEELHLLGEHSHSNVALALEVVSFVTNTPRSEVHVAVSTNASSFVPLSGRLTLVATKNGIKFVDDGLATSVLPAVAALDVFKDDSLALLIGGFDRGVDYVPLAQAIATRTRPTMLLSMGPAGKRIVEETLKINSEIAHTSFELMDEALIAGTEFLGTSGVVLLSPGAPSFDRYLNWEERSSDFARAVTN